MLRKLGKGIGVLLGIIAILFTILFIALSVFKSHETARRSGSLYVGYLDEHGSIQWLPRTVPTAEVR